MIKADKSLGQHFLANAGVVKRIGDVVEDLVRATQASLVVELGPGQGVLTRDLLSRKLRVRAVELDPRMPEILEREFAAEIASQAFTLLPGDALKVPLEEIIPTGETAVVCGNLPYNVGAALVFRFFEDSSASKAFCYMLQKEVVKKFLTSAPAEGERRDYGPPGIKLAWGAQVEGHFWVAPGSFQPPPKVDSGVFWFRRRAPETLAADPLERGGLYDRAGEVVDRLFQQRRKMIRASVPQLKADPLGTRRAEELTPLELLALVRGLR